MTTGPGTKYPHCSFLDRRVGSGQKDGTCLVLMTLLPLAKGHGLGIGHLEDDSPSLHSWAGTELGRTVRVCRLGQGKRTLRAKG